MTASAASRIVAVSADGVRSPVAAPRLEELGRSVLKALRVTHALVSVTLMTTRAMAALNRKHLGHRGPTDIITFALGADHAGVIVADVYICVDVARQHAKAHGVGVREEIARLVVHGMLHACGWEHPDDDQRIVSPMWRRQEQLLKRFWIAPAPRG